MDSIELTENQMLMKKALESLHGKWGVAVGAAAVYMLITAGANSLPVIGGLISFFISGALWMGWSKLALAISRGKKAEFGNLFDGFQRYGTALGAYFLMAIFMILWTLLLIVPGIMAIFSYSMTYYILLDDDTLSPMEAIGRSKEMMMGHRLELFYLMCRFIGWFIVCVVTVGIATLWVLPYFSVSVAKFYQTISGNSAARETTPEPQKVDPAAEISDLIIERVMAMDRLNRDKTALEKEVRETVASLMTSVELSSEEIERIAAEVLKEYEDKQS